MIIFRYFAREIYTTVFAVTLVLVFIFLIDQCVRYLGLAAQGKIAAGAIFHLIGLELPYLLGLLLPLGLYFAVLIAYGKLYAEHEMTVLFAAGMSKFKLLTITLKISAMIFLLVTFLMFVLNPLLAAQKNRIMRTTAASNLVATLIPGEFKISHDGSKIIYVGAVSQEHEKVAQLFVAEQPELDDQSTNSQRSTINQAHGWTITSATQGYVKKDQHDQGEFVVAERGYRYQGEPGARDFFVAQYDEYGVRLPKDTGGLTRDDTDAMSSWYLYTHWKQQLRYQVELQWRAALPISVFLLAVLAMQLSKAQPRQGRFQKFVPAILIYVVYANLIFVAKDAMLHHSLPTWCGLWWAHGFLVLCIALNAWVQRRR